MRALLAVVVAALGVHHTSAGTAAAHRALLRHADLGAGWIAGATPKKPGALDCTGSTAGKGVTEVGAVVSPTYRRSASGPFVSESAFVYDSAASAARYYATVARAKALDCLARSLASGGNQKLGVAFTVTKRQKLAAPRVGAVASAYRVVGRAETQAQRVTIYVDVVLVQRGAAIAQLSFSSFSAPVAAADELRISRAAAARL